MNLVTGITLFFVNYKIEIEAYRPSLQTEYHNKKAKLADKKLQQLYK